MKEYFELLKTAGRDFLDDDCMSSGAAIAYYTTFSLPPLLTIIFMLTTFVGFSEQQVTGLVKRELGLSVADRKDGSSKPGTTDGETQPQQPEDENSLPLGLGNLGIISKIAGLCLLLFSASGVFGQLQYSLDKAWEVKPDPQQGGLWTFITKRLLSAGIVVVIGFFLLVSLVITTLLDEILRWSLGASFQAQVLGVVVNEGLSLTIAALMFAVMFKVLPDAHIAWRDVWGGAICTAILFEGGKFLISWYLDNSQVGSDWGASAVSVIGALVWVYYSSLIVLFGAEITQAWANRFGSGSQPKRGAVRVVTEEHEIGKAGRLPSASHA